MQPASAPRPAADLLDISDLRVTFPGPVGAPTAVVRGVSLSVTRGEIVGLVGESGSGKSLTALSILGLVPRPGRVSGRIALDGEDLLTLPDAALRQVRGGRVGMVFQEPASALNPVLSVGFQVAEAVAAHRRLARRAAREEAVQLLARVALPEPRRRLDDYPHQLSGGQRQRVMIAMALAAGPDLLLADEPTTALDVTVQAQILTLLKRLRDELGLAVLLITHDFGVVAETCDRAVVMYAGEVVEEAPVAALFAAPAHPYTRALLASLPTLDRHGPLPAIPGQPPDPTARPAGCAFEPRCAEAFDRCRTARPELYPVGTGRRARCFLHSQEEPA
ncbi:MAG TPA: ABC transporter ATP-binding protein [Thermoanaerobaculia bacterium]|nr:ABC transporter ATP-binding protein [Thermoanaerobaculia bacterium]